MMKNLIKFELMVTKVPRNFLDFFLKNFQLLKKNMRNFRKLEKFVNEDAI